jgi:plastocyanin
MKTSHILAIAIAAVVIIGLIFFFSGSTDQSGETQNAPAAVESVESPESTESMNTDSQDEALEVTAPAIEGAPAAALDTEVSPEPVSQTAPAAESTSHVFALDSFSYGYSEDEIRVKQGDTVTINLTSSAGFHDWVVDEFGAATEKINVGGTTSVTFVADTAGTFEYYCSVGSHRLQGMVGNLVVEPR